MKVIIAGSRTFSDYPLLKRTMDRFTQGRRHVTVLSGCAKGADALGEKWAKESGIPILHFPALWARHGKSAGYIRNWEMARRANACVVFWDGQSRGSKIMINAAKELGLKLEVVNFAEGDF